MECKQNGCVKKAFVRGWCSMHYSRWQREQSLDAPAVRGLPLLERLWASVDKHGIHKEHMKTRCWEWNGHRDKKGYGTIRVGGRAGSSLKVHRVSWELWHERKIPDGLTIDHLCRTKNCVRPSHLEPVTFEENTHRTLHLKTHCPQGHEYTEENVFFGTNGYRRCRECRYQKALIYDEIYKDRRLELRKKRRAAA